MPAGADVIVGGRRVAGGMVYVGQGVSGASGHIAEPALIDPSLPVDWEHPDWHAEGLDYWPSYQHIPPASRAAYLSWLGHGRAHAEMPIGYVFLYFYGLERRLILDLDLDHSAAEVAELTAEVRRLLGIYGNNGSFHDYATGLLDLAAAAEAYRGQPQPPDSASLERAWEVPAAVRVALGRYVAAGQPIPARWALALLRTHPDVRLRMPASRCRSEYDSLFSRRYTARFNGGMVIRPPQATVELSYRPASSGFRQSIHTNLSSVPDITALSGPITRLQELADECADDLDAFSRYVGRHPDDAGSAEAAGLLPEELLATTSGTTFADLRAWVTEAVVDGPAVVKLGDLVARWAPGRERKLSKADAVLLATLLGRLGVGIEPDVRFGASTPLPGSTVVLFAPPPEAPDAPSATYTAAATLVHLTAVVAAADGSVSEEERRRVAEHLETILGLDDAERRRLGAHLLWLTAGRPALTGLKKRLDALTLRQRSAIGQFLVEVAAADGQITQDEITTLVKVYQHLGLDESEVRQAILGQGLNAVTASPPETGGRGSSVPAEPPPAPDSVSPEAGAERGSVPTEPVLSTAWVGATPSEGQVQLDPDLVRARLAETAAVTALLSGIFADDEEPAPALSASPAELASAERAAVDPVSGPALNGPPIGGLDAAHSGLARHVASQATWDRATLELAAASLGLLLLDGALDRINEAAFETSGEPLVEGDDPLEINDYAVQELFR